MAATTFKPTINIKSSFTTIGAGFTKANKSVGSMRNILLKRTKVKRDAIAGRRSLFGKRIENQRRKDEEAVVEASKPSSISKIGNAVLNSGKGLFDRIVDFAGTLLVGWLVNNLPTIMTMAQDLMGRIQKTVNILGNFMRDIGGIFTGSTKVFGAVLTNITTLDFFDSNKRLSTALGELESVFDDMNKQFDDGLKTLTTPLGQMPGEAPVPPTGTDYTMPPEQVGRGGGGGTVSPQAVYAYLKQLGVSDTHALGILANIQGESGFTVGSQEKSGGGGVGLFQYTYPSRKAAFLKAVPDYKTNWKGQIDFAIKSDPNTPLYLRKQFSSPEEAADDWMRNWENPDHGVYADRRKKHNKFIKDFKSGKSQTSSAQVSSAPIASQPPSGKGNGFLTSADLMKVNSLAYAPDYSDWYGNSAMLNPSAAKSFMAAQQAYGKNIPINSAYRSYKHQQAVSGPVKAAPGHSRHGLGLAIDLQPGTAAYNWMRKNGSKYGWYYAAIPGDPYHFEYRGSGSSSAASVASVPSAAPSLPSTARAPQVMVMDDRPAPQSQQPQVASGGGSAPPMIDSENVLNNLMRNYLLLDLAYT